MMLIALLLVTVVCIALVVFLTIWLKRSIDRIEYLEGVFENMYNQLGTFTEYVENVLNRPSYSNEPTLITMIQQMRDLHVFLRQVEDHYTYDLNLNEENVLLPEKVNVEQA